MWYRSCRGWGLCLADAASLGPHLPVGRACGPAQEHRRPGRPGPRPGHRPLQRRALRLPRAPGRPGQGPCLKQNQQTETPSTSDSNNVTITLPVHPFVGQRLRITRRLRGSIHAPGCAHVEVALPAGRSLRVPLDWTDHGSTPTPVPAVATLAAGARQLLALAQVVAALLTQAAAAVTIRHDASTPPPRTSARSDTARSSAPPHPRESARDGGPARAPRRGPRSGGCQ